MNPIPEWISLAIVDDFKSLVSLGRDKLLMGLRDIEGEAQRLGESWVEVEITKSDKTNDAFAEEAVDAAGVAAAEHYLDLLALRQSTLNMLAAWVFHLYEQHVGTYRRFMKFRKKEPCDVAQLECPDLKELRHVANTVKHGEDRNGELRNLRPDLFKNPYERDDAAPGRAHAPLTGDGLFVTEADLDRYEAAVVSLWTSIIEAHK